MAQRRSLAWTELRVGILVITSFALLALAIFYVGGQRGFFVKTYTVKAYFQNANNLRDGAEVSLEGVTIGNVDSVKISKEADPTKAVVAALKVDSEYKNIIRSDSKVSISTIGLLGDSAVDITRGADALSLRHGGFIRDIRRIVHGANDVVANFQVLSEDFKKITERIDNGEGTLGKFLTDTAIYDNADAVVREMHTLVRDARTGPGTMGKLLTDDAVYRKMTEIEDHIDTLVMKIERGQGTLGRFVNDPSLYNRMDHLTARF